MQNSKKAQLTAVIIIVLLVAAVGGFYVFSEKRSGKAVLSVSRSYTVETPTREACLEGCDVARRACLEAAYAVYGQCRIAAEDAYNACLKKEGKSADIQRSMLQNCKDQRFFEIQKCDYDDKFNQGDCSVRDAKCREACGESA